MATHRAPRPVQRRITGALGAALLGAGLLLGLTPTASAQLALTGTVRLGHLSPTTPAVDMYLASTSADPAGPPLAEDVSYGAVTPYEEVEAGRYVVAVRPQGASPVSPPLLTTTLDIAAGSSQSLLFFDSGPGGAVQGRLLPDQIDAVPAGSGLVRIVQGAALQQPLDVQAAGGPRLATDLRYGTATEYASVQAAVWNVAFSAGDLSTRATLDVADGSATTVVVTQDPSGELEVTPVIDVAGGTAQDAPPVVVAPVPTGPPAVAPEEPAATPDVAVEVPQLPAGGVPAGAGGALEDVSVVPILLALLGSLLLVYATTAGRMLRRESP